MNAKVNQNMKKNIFEFLKVNKKVKLTLRDNHDQLMFKYVIGIYQRAFISLKMNKERRVRNRLISF